MEIMGQQRNEKRGNLEKDVTKTLQKKEQIVRHTVAKKSMYVVVFEVIERNH